MANRESEMIKILFFIPGLSEGGAEKVMRSLVNHMDQEQFEMTVQTIDLYDSSQFLAKGIRYKAINKCKSKWGRKLFSYWFRLCAEMNLAYRFFVKDDYDIEVAYLETVATKIIAQSTNKGAVKIAWVHCDLSKKEGIKEARDKIRKQYEKFDKIVCVSEDAKKGFQKLFGSDLNTVVLPNVIDDDEIRRKADEMVPCGIGADKIRLVAVGRLTLQKNFSYLIDTCEKLRNSECDFKLDILGEGPEQEKLEQQISALALEDYVTLQGFVSNPYPWIKQADIVVCSSKYEGISTVVQEALILGKPVVTTPCTGMAELLGNSEYGMIVDDSKEGLYTGLYQMITSKELRELYTNKAEKRSGMLSKAASIRITQDFFMNELTQR